MNPISRVVEDVEQAAEVLGNGGIVAIPTETVYGLAALAHDQSAVERVFAVKGRPRSHPLIVHVSSVATARRWGRIDSRAGALVEEYWPGPLTIVVPRTDHAPDWVTGGRDTVAIRMPDHQATLGLLDILEDALVAPSANRFGKVSPTRAEHVVADLGTDVDLVLDGGACAIGLESTIVELVDDVQILRPGAISAAQIARTIAQSVADGRGESRAPGMMASHYAPKANVELSASIEDAQDAVARHRRAGTDAVVLHESDPTILARTLYGALRDADRDGVQVVVVVRAPDTGIGVAVNDRLEKAAADRRQD